MDRNIDQINVIPLVDVMLVLLVIVLTTATFISTGQIPVNLAKAKAVSDRQDVPIVIALIVAGNEYVKRRKRQHEALRAARRPLVAETAQAV